MHDWMMHIICHRIYLALSIYFYIRGPLCTTGFFSYSDSFSYKFQMHFQYMVKAIIYSFIVFSSYSAVLSVHQVVER